MWRFFSICDHIVRYEDGVSRFMVGRIGGTGWVIVAIGADDQDG